MTTNCWSKQRSFSLIELSGVQTVRVLATVRRNFRPHLVSLLDSPPQKLFASGEEVTSGRGNREEVMKQRVYYMEYMKATCVLLGVVSVYIKSWRQRKEQGGRSNKEKDEERRRTEEQKKQRSTTTHEWKKQRCKRAEQMILVFIQTARCKLPNMCKICPSGIRYSGFSAPSQRKEDDE